MTTIRTLSARPIDAAAFAPYGQLLEQPANGTRDDYVGRLEAETTGRRANLAVIRATPRPLPLRIDAMERHPFSSQAFLPLAVERYLVLCCPSRADGTPDLDRLDAFIVRGDQGLNYSRGTWHHPMTTIGTPGTFAMFMWDELGPRDTEWSKVSQPIVVTVD